MRLIVGLLRLVVAATGVVALVGDFVYTLGFSAFATANWFAYFTQQSAAANVVVLAVSGALAVRGRSEPRWFAGVHALVATYVIVSGLVFGVIVAESASHSYTMEVPWSSQVLHFWVPAFVLVDWVLAPGRTRVGWWVLSVVLAFPLTWGVVTIVRGADVGWYPYFFLDPAQVAWPGEYLAFTGLALATIVGVLCALVALSRWRPDERLRRAERLLAAAGPVPPEGAAEGGTGGAGRPGQSGVGEAPSSGTAGPVGSGAPSGWSR